MKKLKTYSLLSLVLLLFLASCNEDEKAAEVLAEEVERGAFLRTLDRVNSEFDILDLDAQFEIVIQEQDLEDGDLLESVDVSLRFIDNTIENTDFSTSETLIETIGVENFDSGTFELPITTLKYSFSELLNMTGVASEDVAVKDQFVIRLKLNLTDGRTFSYENSSGCILLIESYFDSPFTYTINIVEPIAPDLFTGEYIYESILDGPLGPTWGPPILVEIRKGNSDNLRIVSFDIVPDKIPRDYFFSIVGDESVFEKYQARFSANNLDCGPSGNPIVLGPDVQNAFINPIDDSVFELWFVEGYEGWDGNRGFGTAPSRIRFTKQ